MSKKDSILFQVTVFFIFIFIVINIIVALQFLIDNHVNKTIYIKRYFESIKIIEESRENRLDNISIDKKLKSLYTEISKIDLEVLKREAIIEKNTEDGFPIEIFYFKGKKYVHLIPPKNKPRFEHKEEFRRDRFKPIVLVDYLTDKKVQYFWLLILLSIDILLIWFYYFLYKKLKPLINLKNEITKFSKGNLNINTKVGGKDEISQVSNEFNNAINKIRELNDSRKLFLRNILHELKTPITKGKLISDTLEDSRRKEILQKAFSRLEYLLGEFVKLEEFSSGKINLVKKEYRVIDLLDQAVDILMVDREDFKINTNLTKIDADFEIFSIALKNLLDNALRYNTNGKIEIFVNKDSLLIKNMGKPLKKDFESYLKPFSREYESIDKGLGLGLYITNNVIESHGFKLYYSYSSNYHLFKIQFKIDSN